MEGSEIHGKQVDMQNTRAKKTDGKGCEQRSSTTLRIQSSDVASGSPTGRTSRFVRALFDGGLRFIEVIHL